MTEAIQQFLSEFTPEVRDTSQTLRELVKRVAPGCSETLHTGWKVISYGHKKKFCAIAPHAKWVNLQFHSGAQLSDTGGLLQGTGKSMRHVKIVPGTAVGKELEALVREASELGQAN